MTTVENQPSSDNFDRIKSDFLANHDAAAVLARRTALVDETVLQAFAEHLVPAGPSGVALLAVGGYGRRQLFPYSDVDLLLLFDNDRGAAAAADAIASFLRSLWDAGLRASHSVRTPAECAELHDQNIELNVSLLDQRLLAGDPALYSSLTERLPRFIHNQRDALSRNLSRLTRDRHAKFHHTFYHLEPNVKETPGGLRDFQLICWLDQVRLTTAGNLAPLEERGELTEARDFLFTLRCFLHCLANRDANGLNFEAQDWISENWRRPAAEWMRGYFRHARDIHRVATRVLESNEARASTLFSQFRDWRSRLSNADFTVTRERVHFRVPQAVDKDPDLVLRLFLFVARHGILLSRDAEARIAAVLPALSEYFSKSRPLWPALQDIFVLPYARVALRGMHETGVLTAIFPELQEIECLVIRDFYHRYTVDEHTLVTIQNLAELRDAKDKALARYGELLSEMENPGILVFALLFHDSGKGDESQGHVDGSLKLAERAMARIQMPETPRQEVRFLIGAHLEMSATMTGRDPYDAATAEYMAHKVATVERLKALTLVTYADISAVNPAAMTPWRNETLWRLYTATYHELTRELESERIEPLGGSPERDAFLEGFPTRYLRTHAAAEIDAHLKLETASRSRGVATQLARAGAVYRLTIVARDRPFLFASIAGTLSGFGMNILKAEAFGNRRGTILDTFIFADPLRTLELNPTEVDRLQLTVERVVLGKTDVKHLLQNRPKPSTPARKQRVTASVAVDNQLSKTATLIQIVAEDRPGLLYDLASAMSAQGCNIEVVLIDTEAYKAIDVFYVTAGGQKLSDERQRTVREAILQVVG